MGVISPLHLNVGITGQTFTTGLPPISAFRRKQGLITETVELDVLSHLTEKVCGGKCQALSLEEGKLPEELKLQEFQWREFFADPTQWWDCRRSKPTPRHPDFRHKKSKVALWLDDRHKPAWVDSQLASWDAERKRPAGPSAGQRQGALGRLAGYEGHLEVGICRKLCEDGRITDAVDALNLLKQRGCHISTGLLYRVLKGCIARKDLALGKRIHALAIKSGYDGDAFLATHLIGLYASFGRLEEAMRVFAKVSTADSYNWASIIFACTRQGEAAQAIQLYGQMRESAIVKADNRIYVAVLKACGSAADLVAGKEVHSHILEGPGKPDVFVQTGLVDMYAKCRSLQDARRVFDNLPERNIVTWNAMIAGYAQQGMGREALSIYTSMQQDGIIHPDYVTFVCLLQACASVGREALKHGKQLHAQIAERGLQHDMVVGGSLVNMYAKCGSLDDGRTVFDKLRERSVVTWTTMIAAYAQQGMGEEALGLYDIMQKEGLSIPDSVTFVCLLQACASVGARILHQGKQLHAQIVERGLQNDMVLGGSLINMYVKCGSLQDAHCVFDRLSERNVVTWTAMIAGYAQQGMGQEALSLFNNMQQEGLSPPDSVTLVCLLQACASVGRGALHQGKQLHAQIEEQGLQDDVVLGGSLVSMYAQCGTLSDARSLFDKLPGRNVVTWTAMIAAYAEQGMGQEALSLYNCMQLDGFSPPDCVTFVCLLQACASVGVGALHQGKQLQLQIEDRGLLADMALGGSLVNMHVKCGSLDDARNLFDRLPFRNVVTWTAMIAGYADQGMGKEALSLCNSMQQEGLSPPDSVTFVCLLQACATVGLGAVHRGTKLHAQIVEQGLQDDLVLGGSLVNMYAKCGCLEEARRVFDRLPERNVVTWNAMLAGYVQQGLSEEALTLYSDMRREDITPPDSFSFVCLLQACSIVAALPLGQQFHAQIEERRLQGDLVVGVALIDMYAKCGSMLDSQQVFDSLPERSIEAWGALAGGYTRQGDSEAVFDLLDRMKLEGVQPDGIIFLVVLTVCSHVGLVDEGRKYFEAMRTDYGISPTVEHYTCLMDLLGRAGHLDEALQMAKTMPFSPDGAVWVTLLSACQKWDNVEIGTQAFDMAVSVDAKDASLYAMMSNIYACAQMWEEAEEMQARRVKSGAWKKPGQSWWTDKGGLVHTFLVGDKAHAEKEVSMPGWNR